MDRMTFGEINSLFKFSYYKNQENWEQTRFLGFITAKSHGVKISKMTDMVGFPWDKKTSEKPQEMSEQDIQRLKDKANWMINNNILETN